jgi:hypothetical protein
MMKRGTPDHPKTKALAARLDLRRWQVVGLLEALWHFTAQYAKRGNIGKWTNKEIACALEWEGDADGLISALLETGWLEVCTVNRLLVHDWQDHADQTVKRSDEVVKLGFASLQLANARQPSLASPRQSQSQSLASPSPSPSTNGEKLADGDGGEDGGDIWNRVKSRAAKIYATFHARKPRVEQRRKIAACLYLVERGDFKERWISEGVAAARKADKDPWGYLWTCLRNDANDMGKELCRMVADIDLPEGF